MLTGKTFYVRFTSDSSEPQLLYWEEYQHFLLSQQHRDKNSQKRPWWAIDAVRIRRMRRAATGGMIKEESPMIALLQSKLCKEKICWDRRDVEDSWCFLRLVPGNRRGMAAGPLLCSLSVILMPWSDKYGLTLVGALFREEAPSGALRCGIP